AEGRRRLGLLHQSAELGLRTRRRGGRRWGARLFLIAGAAARGERRHQEGKGSQGVSGSHDRSSWSRKEVSAGWLRGSKIVITWTVTGRLRPRTRRKGPSAMPVGGSRRPAAGRAP